ncbi:MAG: hypothetical protein MPJ78_19140 [Hyphomicrobiaceae bacterium]|nr:hypothetical protein [Hyphomicrobiaceae bacterium]
MVRLFIAFLVSLPVLIASETALHAANLTLKVFLMDEVKACPPRGYMAGRKCPLLPANRIEAIYNERIIRSYTNIPPNSEILLNALLPNIRQYALHRCTLNRSCDDPRERQVLMLLFEWSEPITAKIRFERKEKASFPGYVREANLSNRRRWLNHQRAEYFFPLYNIEWVLSIGSDTWTLKTR